ncbi:MAG: hypothetical protein GF330_00525 [Candidatus Eisenbacteria bacterium]|nr:hypothetical protein [Candidatus Eisenbacteria bacterium]
MFNVFDTRVVVEQTDPLKSGAEALAFAANDHLWMGAGLGGELKQNGGEEVEVEAVRQGPAELGRCVATGGGGLPLRRIYHLVVMGQDLKVQPEAVRTALGAALRQAMADGVPVLEVAPLVSEEQMGVLRDVAREAVAALFETLGEDARLERIILSVGSEQAADTLREAFFQVIRGGH